jgi:pre-mRNA-splicing factor 38A
VHMDEFVDELLVKDRSCATSLWKLPRREVLEDLEQLEVRVSPLQEELDAMDDEDEEIPDADGKSDGDGGSEEGRSVNGGSRSRSRSPSGSMSD